VISGCGAFFGRAQCFVDGAWSTPCGEPAAVVIDPFSEQPIGEVAEAGGPLVEKAVLAATHAQAAWSGLELDTRLAMLEGVADGLDRDGSALAATVTREMGMPVTLATTTQAHLPARVLRAAAQTAREFPWRQAVLGATLVRRPAGVAVAITPWNMPVYQIILKLSAALAAGCTVVLKASDTDYGLSAEVYSADRDHAERFAGRLDCGQVKINGVRTRDHPSVPFGGTKLSGYGRELGALGLAEMTEVTAVMS
jgi:aldehyde dehydrogenase (NAD+)